MLTVSEILAIIDSRIESHRDRIERLDAAVEDYQRLQAWHRAAVVTLADLKEEIEAHDV